MFYNYTNVTDWMSNVTVINDALSGALSRVPSQSIGVYPITIGTLSAGPNYVTNYIGANLAIIGSPIPQLLFCNHYCQAF
jgi:hypothetical protein